MKTINRQERDCMESISKIQSALQEITTELAILEKEVPGISLSFWFGIMDAKDKSAQEHAANLTQRLKVARLRKKALAKLTSQEREALNVSY